MRPASSNPERLRDFVQACLEGAARRPGRCALSFLQANLAQLQSRLDELARWAGSEGDCDPPPELVGVTAFDLSDAMEVLSAEAFRRSCAAPRSSGAVSGPS